MHALPAAALQMKRSRLKTNESHWERVMADLKGESETWQRAYSEDQLVARRLKKHWSKLQGMGIERWAKKDRLLDVCCGTGEVLGLLRKQGFSNLYGMDVTPPSTSGLEGVDIRRGDARALPYADG